MGSLGRELYCFDAIIEKSLIPQGRDPEGDLRIQTASYGKLDLEVHDNYCAAANIPFLGIFQGAQERDDHAAPDVSGGNGLSRHLPAWFQAWFGE